MEPGRENFRRKSKFRISQKSRKNMTSYFGEYCENTSIHGFKYLGETNRSCLEKLWWFITISFCVFVCVLLILKTWDKWQRSPVIVSFATKQMPIFEIPFPAVTICPEVNSDKTKCNFSHLLAKLKKGDVLNDKERKNFEYMSLICEPEGYDLTKTSTTVDEDVLNFFDEVIPPFSDTGILCQWLGMNSDCKDLFNVIYTDEGVCYTFNMLDRTQIFNSDVLTFKEYFGANISIGYSLEGGYNLNQTQDSYPRRALYPGAKSGLVIQLKTLDENLEYRCGNSLQGFKILLHHPTEIPRVSQQYFRLPLNEAVVAALTPEMITTTAKLQTYDADKRQCYFQEERDLAFFKIYTQKNCEIECLRNSTLHSCGCVDFHMPRHEGEQICGPANIECMKRAERVLLSKEIDIMLEERKNEEENNTNFLDNIQNTIQDKINVITKKTPSEKPKPKRETCNCLPSCTSIIYNAETSQSEWQWEVIKRENQVNVKGNSHAHNRKLEHYSMLVVYFKDTQFIPSERDELYGPIDFLANCGGLLGLFTGFSFISFVEILYFLTLRLCCNIRLYGRTFWHGSKNN